MYGRSDCFVVYFDSFSYKYTNRRMAYHYYSISTNNSTLGHLPWYNLHLHLDLRNPDGR